MAKTYDELGNYGVQYKRVDVENYFTLPIQSVPTSDSVNTDDGAVVYIDGSGADPAGGYIKVNGTWQQFGFDHGNLFTNGGNSFAAPAVLGTNDANYLSFKANNTEAMRIFSSTRNIFVGNTPVDSGFKLDVNGTLRVNGVQTFQTSNIRINHSGSPLGNVIIGDSVNSLGGTANRAVVIGNSNNLSGITSQPYINVLGYSNTCNVNITPVYVNGNFNIINGVGYNDIKIIGDGNTRTAGGHSTIIGSQCIVNHTGIEEGDGCVVIGNVSSVLHNKCSIIGNNVSTTANNQLIIAQNGVSTTDGYNDVYFGTGPVRSAAQAAFMNDVRINGSGAASGVTDASGASIIIAGGKGLSAGTGGDVILATSTSTGASGTTRQSLTNRWWVKWNTGQLANVSSPNASAAVQVDSTTQGFLPPRMTAAQAEAISSPAEGLMVYSTDGGGSTITTKGWWGWNGATWEKLNN